MVNLHMKQANINIFVCSNVSSLLTTKIHLLKGEKHHIFAYKPTYHYIYIYIICRSDII